MEFFEQAHVSKTKKDDKKEDALKKKLTQLLHAYKKGDNEEIHHVGQQDIKYDYDDIKSMSELSDLSYQLVDTAQESISSHSSNTVDSNTDNVISSNDLSDEVLDQSLETEKDVKSSLTSEDFSEIDSSTVGNSSILSEQYSDSEISIPSSLQSPGSVSTFSDEGRDEFDADGALASKIMEKLGKKLRSSKKRKEIPITTKLAKEKKIPKKINKNEQKKSNLEKVSDHVPIPVDTDEVDSKSINVEEEMSVDSPDHSINSEIDASTNSCPYVQVSATDMPSLSLDDIIGDYVHPTVKNLPSQKQHIVASPLDKYTILDEMISSEVAEDISSVVPEIDEDTELTFDSDIPNQSTEAIESVDLIEEDSQLDSEDNPIKVYSGSNNYILVMRHPVELSVHGKVKVTALIGSVSIYGYTLENESVDIFAPYCQFAHCIKTTGKGAKQHLNNKLLRAGLTATEVEDIITDFRENDAVISLSSLKDPKITFIDSNFSTELFTRWNDNSTPDFLKKAADDLGCTFYLNQPKKRFEEKATWNEVIECGINANSRGVICGGKGLGKSTFLRYYINRLLSKSSVVVIDLDPGQAEFTVPGNISVSIVTRDQPLIGPNFTHLRQPDRMLNLGMINVMDNPFRYVSAVNELLTYCKTQESYSNLPWIVNTMGMCNDLGHKFITHIICQLKPTFLYQVDSKVPKKRFQFDLQPHMIKFQYRQYAKNRLLATADNPEDLDFKFIKSSIEETLQKGNNKTMPPKELRYLNVLAYFSQLVEMHYGKSILEIVPYEVNISDLNIAVNVNIPQEYLTKVINGKILALCHLPTSDKGKVFSLRDNALECKGYGLIRSIDFAHGILYVLTPVVIEALSSVNTLVYADWMPELHGLEKELPNGTIIPYRASTVNNGAMMSSPRRRFNPLQLIKATRNA